MLFYRNMLWKNDLEIVKQLLKVFWKPNKNLKSHKEMSGKEYKSEAHHF